MNNEKKLQAFYFFRTVRNFLDVYLPLTAKCSENTVKTYRKSLNSFLDYLEHVLLIDKENISFTCFGEKTVKNYIIWMKKEKHLSSKTINLRITAICSFLKYASQSNREVYDYYLEVSLIEGQKVDKKPIQYMDEEAITALLAAIKPDTRLNRRNRMMLILEYELATRISELTDLTLNSLHLDDENPYIFVVGKGDKGRPVPITEKGIQHLKEYLKEFHKYGTNNPLFFSLRDGKPHKLSVDTVEKVIKKAADIARKDCGSVPERVHCHLIRKTRAMDLYKQGVPLDLIARMLGHETVETTTGFYAFATLEMMSDAITKTNTNAIDEPVRYNAKDIEAYYLTLG